jgi:oligoendopeptidase F
MDVTIPRPQKSGPHAGVNFAAVTEAAPDTPHLGALPNWNLTDLYRSPTAPEIEQDLKRSAAAASDFRKANEGKLADLDGAAFLKAIQEYETIQELLGKLMSYAQLVYAGNMADAELARFQQNINERVNAISVEVLFFSLELN